MDVASRIPIVVSQRWDIVHAFDHRPNVSVPWTVARALRKGRCLADWCDWWSRGGIITGRRRFRVLDSMEAWLEEGTKRSAEAVTVISSVLRERALSLGIPEERITLLPSGADVESIQVEDRAECRRELGLNQEGLTLGFIGFAVWDLRILFEAFGRVLKDLPEVKLVWVGKDKDGVFPDFEREFALGDSLIRLGEVPYERISKVLGAMDVHLLPLADNLANRARWPNKLGDYLASGRPVVTMDVGDSGTFVNRHKVGIASKPDTESFSKGILSLAGDQVLRAQTGNTARVVAETVCPWDHSVQILEHLYHSILATAH